MRVTSKAALARPSMGGAASRTRNAPSYRPAKDERRCLCNGLLACVGLGQVKEIQGELVEEPAIVTLGNNLEGVRRLSRQGQVHYHVEDIVKDILG